MLGPGPNPASEPAFVPVPLRVKVAVPVHNTDERTFYYFLFPFLGSATSEVRNVDGQEMSEHNVPYFRNLLGRYR
jgi:hypothetical protein